MGALFSRDALLEKPQAQWDGSTMPSQKGKIAIVTGANSGIGYVTALRLAEAGAHVILACRSEDKARKAEQEMTKYLQAKDTSHDIGTVEYTHVDMGELASVRGFAEQIQTRFTHVDLLVNNAGVSMPIRKTTADGLEAHFAINHLGHFYLTTLLFQQLRAAREARIVHVGSLSHGWVTIDNFSDLAHNTSYPWKRYGTSKLAQTLFMVELQRRLTAANITNVVSVAAHPGVTYTEMTDKVVESIYPWWLQAINKKIGAWVPMQRADMGALTTLFAATVPDLHGGAYVGPSGAGRRSGYPSVETVAAHALDETAATKLWALSEELTKTPFVVK